MSGDGCSATCFIEPGWQCAGAGLACAPICSDGAVVGLEVCDDDNSESDDGCQLREVMSPLFVVSGGSLSALALSARNKPLVTSISTFNAVLLSCFDGTCSSAKLRSLDTSALFAPTVLAVAFTPAQTPLVVYATSTTQLLRVYSCSQADCSSGGLSLLSVAAGSSPSIGFNGALPVLAFVELSTQRLVVLSCADAACSTGSAQYPLGGQAVSSVTLLMGGAAPLLFFTTPDSFVLWSLACDNAACSGSAGLLTEVALDAVSAVATSTTSGLPVVAYRDLLTQGLVVLACGDAVCATSAAWAADRHALVGESMSIASGPGGNTIVVYYDVTSGLWKLAHCMGAGCGAFRSVRLLDSGLGNVPYAAVAFSPTLGQPPVILFGGVGRDDMRLFQCATPDCTGCMQAQTGWQCGNNTCRPVCGDGVVSLPRGKRGERGGRVGGGGGGGGASVLFLFCCGVGRLRRVIVVSL